jgi:hypothetical protein
MHFNLEQILWALVLAAHLVLLIVLLGRDRRFPWFTALTVLSVVRLIADHLLHGKLTSIAFYWQSYVGIGLEGVITILLLIELTRQVFASGKAGRILKPRGWLGWSMVMAAIAAGVVWAWGRPWPTWAQLHGDPEQFHLLLTAITAIKLMLAANMLALETGLLTLAFGKRFGFSWKSYPQQIMLGLSTNAAAILAIQATQDIIRRNVVQKIASVPREEGQRIYERTAHLFSNLDNARNTIWLVVLLWWISWLWRDEPDGANPEEAFIEVPVLAGPPSNALSAEAEIPIDDKDAGHEATS